MFIDPTHRPRVPSNAIVDATFFREPSIAIAKFVGPTYGEPLTTDSRQDDFVRFASTSDSDDFEPPDPATVVIIISDDLAPDPAVSRVVTTDDLAPDPVFSRVVTSDDLAPDPATIIDAFCFLPFPTSVFDFPRSTIYGELPFLHLPSTLRRRSNPSSPRNPSTRTTIRENNLPLLASNLPLLECLLLNKNV